MKEQVENLLKTAEAALREAHDKARKMAAFEAPMFADLATAVSAQAFAWRHREKCPAPAIRRHD